MIKHPGIIVSVTINISIFTAEMIAIKIALVTAKNLPGPIAIATDSLSSLRSIQSGLTKANPNILNNIKAAATQLNTDIKIIWIPSHIGIPGNEAADRLANLATQKVEIDIKVPYEYAHVNIFSEEIANEIWTERWKDIPKLSHYFQISPNLHPNIPKSTTRKESRILFRLRSGYSNLNNNFFKQDCHPTGLCNTRKVPETTLHFLTECKSLLVSKLKQHCSTSDIPFNLNSILNSYSTLKFIAQNIDRQI
jgi:RNase H